MNDQDIAKLLSKLIKSLATKEDIQGVKEDIIDLEMRLGHKINDLETRLGNKIDDLNDKADTILKFAEWEARFYDFQTLLLSFSPPNHVVLNMEGRFKIKLIYS